MKYALILSLLFLVACAGTRPEPEAERVPEAQAADYDESFDPMSLEDGDIVIESTAKIKTEPANDIRSTGPEPVDSEVVLKEIDGFRVQILATNSIENATLVEQEADEQFGVQGHKAYMIFEAPLYKIRVGDCATRDQADDIREMAKQIGYKKAFVVRTKVRVPETVTNSR